jgi:hypothetical protein
MLGRTLPYAGLESNDRKVAHNMLRQAYKESAQGHEQQCKLIAGEIISTFGLKQPVVKQQQAEATAGLPSAVASPAPEAARHTASVWKDAAKTRD